MRVIFRASGGLLGATRGVDLDTATLPESEGRRLRTLVEGSGIEGTREACSEAARDLPLYEIRILRPEGVASLVCDEDRVPLLARGLVSFLIDRAEPLPPAPAAPSSRAGPTHEGG